MLIRMMEQRKSVQARKVDPRMLAEIGDFVAGTCLSTKSFGKHFIAAKGLKE